MPLGRMEATNIDHFKGTLLGIGKLLKQPFISILML